MKQHFWDKRIPSLLGLLLIGVGIATASFFGRQVTSIFLHAAPSQVPTAIRITNVTDSTFTATYITEASVIGSLVLQSDPGSTTQRVILDERDQATGTPTEHQVHSITVRDLQPGKKYTFSINSGTTTYLDGDKPFEVSTGPTIAAQGEPLNPVVGKVVMPGGESPNEAIVYVTLPNAQSLSALVKSSGTYIVPLTGMRAADLTQPATLDDTTVLQVLIANSGLSSTVFVTLPNANPVPLVTLSNDYDFTVNASPIASTSAQALGFPEFPINNNTHAAPEILTPKSNETFTDTQPLINGQALPNATVTITIHSDVGLSATVTSDQNGNWSYRPTEKLAPGNHTVTITTKDQFGVLQTIQKAFTIFQSGTTVAEAATPSATLGAPTNTPTPTAKPTPTITPTPIKNGPTITGTLSPSPTPTLPQSPTPTVTQLLLSPSPTSAVKTKGGLLPTGNNSLIMGAVAGVVTTIIGSALFIFSRGAPL